GVTIYHLTEGLAGRRVLSEAVQERFANYIGRDRADVFAVTVAA
ncbi:MAG: hypothetical protein JWL61_4044, partial [Gemmatimonadetes bacterium]|nr:hypothetical protein [Gemmatimonadota bacterium]